jgi:hypothetical protein
MKKKIHELTNYKSYILDRSSLRREHKLLLLGGTQDQVDRILSLRSKGPAPDSESTDNARHVAPASFDDQSDSTNEYFTDEDSSTTSSVLDCNQTGNTLPAALAERRENIGNTLVAAFSASYHAYLSNKSADSNNTQGETATNTESRSSSSTTRSSKCDHLPGKRQRETDDENCSDEDVDERERRGSKFPRTLEENTRSRLACPFYKKDPIKYKCCQRSKYDAVNRLK